MASTIVKEENVSPLIKCPICSERADKACAACKAVSYCSAEHQKRDWKAHKINCKPFILKENKELGRYVVAARDLKAGSLVLKEIPVASAPKSTFLKNGHLNCCLGCYNLMMMSASPFRTCSKCKWPVCSENCEKFPNHSQNECQLFASEKIEIMSTTEKDILVLKICLLKQQKPSVWEAIKKLQSETELKLKEYDIATTKNTIKAFGLSENVTVDDWLRISKISDVNSFATAITPIIQADGEERLLCGCFLTLEASMFAHSCAPNCIWFSSVAPDVQMVIRTSMNIKKGEMLTISYGTDKNLKGTHQRQKMLSFKCKCFRCLDPFELGSNYSTWVCKECRQGTMVSTNPLEDTSEWKCHSCNAVDVLGIQKVLKQDELNKIVEDAEETEKGAKKMQKLVAKYSGVELHPNHWIITEATRKIVQYIGNLRIQREMSDKERNLYISSCKSMLTVIEKISPGITLEKAQLQYFTAKEMLNKAIDDRGNKKLWAEEFQKELKITKELCSEAYKYYKVECSESSVDSKGPIAVQIEEDLNTIKMLQSGKALVE